MSSAVAGPRFAPQRVDVERRADGSTLLRSPDPLRPFARAVGEWLVQWASRAPERCFLAQRAGDDWRRVTYAEAIDAVRRIGASLLARGLTAATPVAVLSDNSIDHALLALGAMHVGIPVAPISPAYSLLSKDHAKLKSIFELLRPGLVFAEDEQRFAPALAAVGATATPIGSLLDIDHRDRADEAFAAIGPDTVAKILFTSGSGHAQGRHQHAAHALLESTELGAGVAVLEEAPPVFCEWLPWNHTFGGNATFNLSLRNGGTFYIDGGKPTPDLIATTARNLRDVSPTLYFNVPRGYDLLLPLLEADEQLRELFLLAARRAVLRRGCLAPESLRSPAGSGARGAGPAHVHAFRVGLYGNRTARSLCALSSRRCGRRRQPGAGVELKLVPSADKLEVRVKGPNVTPGYYGGADLTRDAFDDEGFYKIGDAMRFVDGEDAAKGLAFDGRVAEDFKIQSGTWVHAGSIRVSLIAACNPLIQDAVITGHDKPKWEHWCGSTMQWRARLVWTRPRSGRLRLALAALRLGSAGSSTAPSRLLVLDLPPSIDEGEITDKGYIQSACGPRTAGDARRASARRRIGRHLGRIVEELYPVPAGAPL